jgi:hypothetical protein
MPVFPYVRWLFLRAALFFYAKLRVELHRFFERLQIIGSDGLLLGHAVSKKLDRHLKDGFGGVDFHRLVGHTSFYPECALFP